MILIKKDPKSNHWMHSCGFSCSTFSVIFLLSACKPLGADEQRPETTSSKTVAKKKAFNLSPDAIFSADEEVWTSFEV